MASPYSWSVTTRRQILAASSLLAVAIGCGAVAQVAGFPPEVMRRSPPEGIEDRALATDQPAPPLSLPSTGGGFELAANGHYLLLFYRGHW